MKYSLRPILNSPIETDLSQPPTLPLHYGTFPPADTGYEALLRDLKAALAERFSGHSKPTRTGWVH